MRFVFQAIQHTFPRIINRPFYYTKMPEEGSHTVVKY